MRNMHTNGRFCDSLYNAMQKFIFVDYLFDTGDTDIFNEEDTERGFKKHVVPLLKKWYSIFRRWASEVDSIDFLLKDAISKNDAMHNYVDKKYDEYGIVIYAPKLKGEPGITLIKDADNDHVTIIDGIFHISENIYTTDPDFVKDRVYDDDVRVGGGLYTEDFSVEIFCKDFKFAGRFPASYRVNVNPPYDIIFNSVVGVIRYILANQKVFLDEYREIMKQYKDMMANKDIADLITALVENNSNESDEDNEKDNEGNKIQEIIVDYIVDKKNNESTDDEEAEKDDDTNIHIIDIDDLLPKSEKLEDNDNKNHKIIMEDAAKFGINFYNSIESINTMADVLQRNKRDLLIRGDARKIRDAIHDYLKNNYYDIIPGHTIDIRDILHKYYCQDNAHRFFILGVTIQYIHNNRYEYGSYVVINTADGKYVMFPFSRKDNIKIYHDYMTNIGKARNLLNDNGRNGSAITLFVDGTALNAWSCIGVGVGEKDKYRIINTDCLRIIEMAFQQLDISEKNDDKPNENQIIIDNADFHKILKALESDKLKLLINKKHIESMIDIFNHKHDDMPKDIITTATYDDQENYDNYMILPNGELYTIRDKSYKYEGPEVNRVYARSSFGNERFILGSKFGDLIIGGEGYVGTEKFFDDMRKILTYISQDYDE